MELNIKSIYEIYIRLKESKIHKEYTYVDKDETKNCISKV